MSELEKKELISSIETALNEIRPHLEVDGGDIKIIDITEDMIVQVQWLGNCQTCSMSEMTMKAGVEQIILNRVSSIKGVMAIA